MPRVNLGQQALLDYIQRGLTAIGERVRGQAGERMPGSPSVLDMPGQAIRGFVPATEQAAIESSLPVGKVVPEDALKRMTGEVLKSVPTALRRPLQKKARLIRVGEEMMEDRKMGRWTPITGLPGEGRSIEEAMVHADLPEEVKRRVLGHELGLHAVERETPLGGRDIEMPTRLTQFLRTTGEAAPGIETALGKRGYSWFEQPEETLAQATELTLKPRYMLSGTEEKVREAFVKLRRQEAQAIEKAHKAAGRARRPRGME